MPRFLTLWQYAPEAQAALVRKPEDRSKAIADLVSQAGGQLHDYYYTFGEYDGAFIFETPDDVSAQAVTFAIAGSGMVRHERTINLQTVEEKMKVLDQASQLHLKTADELAG